jgi:hypothetical protein
MFIMRGEITNLKLTSVLVLGLKLFTLNFQCTIHFTLLKEFLFRKDAAAFLYYLMSPSHLFNWSHGFGKKSIKNDLARHDTR